MTDTLVVPDGGDAGRDAGFDARTDGGLDAGFDGGLDAGFDGGLDAGFDGGLDAGGDAGFDAGPRPRDGGWVAFPVPVPLTEGFAAIHGTAVDDVWVSGTTGVILHFDGQAWASVPSGTSLFIRSIWARARNDVWFVGDGPTVRRWNGTSVVAMTPPNTMARLESVFGFGPDDVWTSGGSNVYRWNGTQWLAPQLGLVGGFTIRAIWGASANDIWFGSTTGLFRFNGLNINAVPSSAFTSAQRFNASNINGIWGSSSADVWFLGIYNDTILRWSGAGYTTLPITSNFNYSSIHGSGPTNVWIVDWSNPPARWNGTSWTSVPAPVSQTLRAVWTSGPDDVWVVGDRATILHGP